jgi:hypothetical protein
MLTAPLPGLAQQAAPGAQSSAFPDGKHDFDFELGTWKTHIHRLVHPLTGSTTWTDYDGTSVVRKIWNGPESELDRRGHADKLMS